MVGLPPHGQGLGVLAGEGELREGVAARQVLGNAAENIYP